MSSGLRDLPHWSVVLLVKSGQTQHFVCEPWVHVCYISGKRDWNDNVVLYGYTLVTLSIRAVQGREESSRVYGPLVRREGRCGTARQWHFTGTLSEDVHFVVGSNPNLGRNLQESEAEGVFLNSDWLVQDLMNERGVCGLWQRDSLKSKRGVTHYQADHSLLTEGSDSLEECL